VIVIAGFRLQLGLIQVSLARVEGPLKALLGGVGMVAKEYLLEVESRVPSPWVG
jgi:hypothetical protein